MKKIIPVMILMVLFSVSVFALGVVMPYWNGNDLVMSPGESKTIYMEVQNVVGDSDVSLKVTLISGDEVTDFKSQVIELPKGTKQKVALDIDIPGDAPLGNEWIVGVDVETLAPGGGMVQLGSKISKNFKVMTQAPTPTGAATQDEGFNGKNIFYATLLVIIVAAVIFNYIRKSNVSSGKKKVVKKAKKTKKK